MAILYSGSKAIFKKKRMKLPIRIFNLGLIALLILITIFDSYFALKSPFLETNPFLTWLGMGFLPFILLKVAVTAFFCYHIYKNIHRGELALYSFSATLILFIALWGYGATSGFYNSNIYLIEEAQVIEGEVERITEVTGTPPTIEEVDKIQVGIRQAVQEEVTRQAVPYYIRLVWMFGIYPYFFSIASFALFRKLRKTVIYKPKKRKNEKK